MTEKSSRGLGLFFFAVFVYGDFFRIGNLRLAGGVSHWGFWLLVYWLMLDLLD